MAWRRGPALARCWRVSGATYRLAVATHTVRPEADVVLDHLGLATCSTSS
jgi:phosphoglycolate phosphatase-like HAD superfamily hydrolase